MSIVGCKNRIETLLCQLVPDTLAEVKALSFKHDKFDFEDGIFPLAVVTPPAITVETLDNKTNTYNCEFDIEFMMQGDDIGNDDSTAVETIIATILTKLANDPTLNGEALAGSEIVLSAITPTLSQHKNKDFISFSVILNAQVTELLTFA